MAAKMFVYSFFIVALGMVSSPGPSLALCPGDCLCDNTRLIVNCSRVYLKEVPMTLNPHIKVLSITQASLERLQSNMQFYPDLVHCNLAQNRLTKLPHLTFESQASLKWLDLSDNNIGSLSRASFVGLGQVEYLSLKNNQLSHLGPRAFTEMYNLKSLDLSGNSITTVSRDAFQGLEDHLHSLDISQNRLAAVPVDSLSRLVNLMYLSLAYNSLQRLEMSASRDYQLPSLSSMDLSHTRAERINVCHLLDLAPKLEHLTYLGNPVHQLACIESNNIHSLELGHTEELISLDPAVFYSMARLKRLSVSSASELNEIAIDTWMANTQLEQVDINSNAKLTAISLEVFAHLPSLRTLSLRNNSLRQVYPVEGSRLNQLELLDISENPLDCNCTMRSLTVAGLKADQLVCHTSKDDMAADFLLTANTLFGDVSCLTPFTVKLLFLAAFTLVLILLFSVSLTVQAVYFSRKKRQSQQQLLISLPTNKIVTSDLNSLNSSSMLNAWQDHQELSRSMDNLDKEQMSTLKPVLSQEQLQHQLQPNRYYTSLKHGVSYFEISENHGAHFHHNSERTCDCSHLHHSQHHLYY